MKKQILSIGKVLSRVEQKQVFGGAASEGECDDTCTTNADCTDPSFPICGDVIRDKTCPGITIKECIN